ncbi:hypothetical protein Tco_0308215 [Tanacetum coccineum]
MKPHIDGMRVWLRRERVGARLDGLSVVEVNHMLVSLGYVNPKIQYWYKMPNKDALLPLSNDSDVLRFTKDVDRFKLMQLYVVHLVDKPKAIGDNENHDIGENFDPFFCDLDPEVPNVAEPSEVPNVAEPSEVPDVAEQSERSEDSEETKDRDFDVELEDMIDDVEVDMDDFRK